MPLNTREMSQLPNAALGQELAGATIGDPNSVSNPKSGNRVERSEHQWRILEATLSSIADFAYTFDRDGRFLFVNSTFVIFMGQNSARGCRKELFRSKVSRSSRSATPRTDPGSFCYGKESHRRNTLCKSGPCRRTF